MAGYRRKPKVYRLEFTDPDFEGLVVRARTLPLQDFLELTESAAKSKDNPEAGAEDTRRMIRLFSASLVEWNLEDDFGEPVPATFEAMLKYDLGFIITIIGSWMDAMASVSPNLPAGSNSGGTSQEASIPMESLSPSRQS